MQVHSCRPQPSHTRGGFTLVELLVAMAIFVTLAGIAISSFRATTDDDRIAAAAQQIKSSINGAQSRALRDRSVRGIRFLRDPQNPTQCNSLQYIGATANDQGFIDKTIGINKSVSYFSRFDMDGNPFDEFQGSDHVPSPTVLNVVTPLTFNAAGAPVESGTPDSTMAIWRQLVSNGSLVAGRQIELPKGSNRFYTISSVVRLNPGTTPEWFGLSLSEPLEVDTGRIVPTALPFLTVGFVSGLDYSLELGYGPLPDEPPVALPKGTVIDLDGSDIPNIWRPTDANGDSTITLNEYPNCDLMFSSTGKIIGTPASAGMIHFYVGNLEEVDKFNQARFDGNDLSAIRPRKGSQPPDIPADDPGTPGIDETQKKPARWVTLLTSSGQLYSSDINAGGTTVAAKLKFAKRGEEAGR